jgi:1,2-phenylacetyl-CoA epoxidase catalytic subunit
MVDMKASLSTATFRRLVRTKRQLGFRVAFWAGRGCSIDAGIALAGMALEEIGHGRILENLAGGWSDSRTSETEDRVTWRLWAEETEMASATEEAWPTALVRFTAKDMAATTLLRAMRNSWFEALAERATKMVEEEVRHEEFSVEELLKIARGVPRARDRLRAELLQELASRRSYGPSRSDLQRLAADGIISTEEVIDGEAWLREKVTALLKMFR